jgi:hypothetical protein
MNTQSDFAQWLSPMLVKELRQGMRSRVFVISFLLLQVAMLFVVLIGLASAKSQDSATITSGIFWFLISVPLLLVMPIAGLGAIASERKANSLELIFLTRLTPRRIITGKWLALVAQTVLLVCAVLPYAVLRYFTGGIELGTEFGTLAGLLISSALLSAITVGLSPQMSGMMRVLLTVGFVLSLNFVVPLLAMLMTPGFTGTTTRAAPLAWPSYVAFVLLGIAVLLVMLEFGASKIAPAAANHSTSRRLLGLGLIVLLWLVGFAETFETQLFWFGAALLVPICVGALCEAPSEVPSVYRPFVRRGLAGRIAGRVLYPGWASGVWYTLLVLLAGLLPLYYLRVRATVDPQWILWGCVAGAGTLLLPAAVNHTFFARLRKPLWVFLGVQIACALLAAMSGIVYGLGAGDLRPIAATIPTAGLLLTGTGVTEEMLPFVLTGTAFVTAISLVLLLARSRRVWRDIRAREAAAAHLGSPTPRDALQHPAS